MAKVVLRKKPGRSRFEETATFEFECRRFSAVETDQQRWRAEVKATWDEYDEINRLVKQQTNETLENLRLQSQVYREEVNSLKRQIDDLKREREHLAEHVLPAAVNRRRSCFNI